MAPLLQVEAIHKSFGPINVLRGVDLTLHAGEVLALVGDNGAGKSTLIKHIAGIYHADDGEIRLNGQPIPRENPREVRRMGVETVYQDLALADDLSVGANIFLGREPVRRWLGVLPMIDNGRSGPKRTHCCNDRQPDPTPRRALFRGCRADNGRRWRSRARCIGRPRS